MRRLGRPFSCYAVHRVKDAHGQTMIRTTEFANTMDLRHRHRGIRHSCREMATISLITIRAARQHGRIQLFRERSEIIDPAIHSLPRLAKEMRVVSKEQRSDKQLYDQPHASGFSDEGKDLLFLSSCPKKAFSSAETSLFGLRIHLGPRRVGHCRMERAIEEARFSDLVFLQVTWFAVTVGSEDFFPPP